MPDYFTPSEPGSEPDYDDDSYHDEDFGTQVAQDSIPMCTGRRDGNPCTPTIGGEHVLAACERLASRYTIGMACRCRHYRLGRQLSASWASERYARLNACDDGYLEWNYELGDVLEDGTVVGAPPIQEEQVSPSSTRYFENILRTLQERDRRVNTVSSHLYTPSYDVGYTTDPATGQRIAHPVMHETPPPTTWIEEDDDAD